MPDPITPNYDWVRLGSAWVYKDDQQPWVKVRIDFVPNRPINAFLVGPNCQNMGNGYKAYYFLDNFSLTDAANLAYKTIRVDTLGCPQGFVLHAPPGSGAAYQWYKNGIALSGATAATLSVPPQAGASGSYTVRLTYPTHCITASDVPMFITSTAALDIGSDTTLCTGDSIVLRSNLAHPPEAGMNSGITYRWSTGSTNSVITVKTPGSYSLTATNAAGCSTAATATIAYQGCESCSVWAPTAFTPNSDGLNDTWGVRPTCPQVAGFRLRVYSRWGSVVYESRDPQRRWDGKLRGIPMPSGVYTYQVQWRNPASRQSYQTQKGTIALLP